LVVVPSQTFRCKWKLTLIFKENARQKHSSGYDQTGFASNFLFYQGKLMTTEFMKMHPDQKCDLLPVGSTVNGCGAFNSGMDI
jgi:hypothetical protein